MELGVESVVEVLAEVTVVVVSKEIELEVSEMVTHVKLVVMELTEVELASEETEIEWEVYMTVSEKVNHTELIVMMV